jgi:hypothetical protein
MQQHDKAIEDFEMAINIQTNYPLVYYYRGMSKIFTGKLLEAIKDF